MSIIIVIFCLWKVPFPSGDMVSDAILTSLLSPNPYYTQFIEDHPGGRAPILRHAGKDATKIFMPLHPPGTLESGIDQDKMIGLVDPTTVKEVEMSPEEAHSEGKERGTVPLGQIIGLPDFAVRLAVSRRSVVWCYYYL
jgi:L-lactate dehydrogenase (cytochrome)